MFENRWAANGHRSGFVPPGFRIKDGSVTQWNTPKFTGDLIISMAISGTDWRYLPYIRPMFQAYVREYPHKIWPEKWYSTSILGSWNSH